MSARDACTPGSRGLPAQSVPMSNRHHFLHRVRRHAVVPPLRWLATAAAGSLLVWAAPAWTQAQPPRDATPAEPAAPQPAPPAAAASATGALPKPAPAPAKAPSSSGRALERVEITGARADDTEDRRRATAAKIVIGREELERQGDANVAEILKRLPGVTLGGRPGRGGEIRMRGLGSGYTQILINGERTPPGFSFDQITPDLVERIEVLRAPTAETGARAIAGTINIILRDDVKKRLNTLKLALGHEDHGWQPSASWTRAEQLEDFSYNFNANLNAGRRDSDRSTRTQVWSTASASSSEVLDLDQVETFDGREQRRHASLGGRAQWRLGAGNSLSLVPFVQLSQSDASSTVTRTVLSGSSAARYDHADVDTQGRFGLARLNAFWQNRWADGWRSELRAGASSSRWTGNTWREEFSAGQPIDDSREHTVVDDRWWTLSGKASRTLVSGHALAGGIEFDLGQRDQTSETQGSSAADDQDDNLKASTLRSALWLQDEWDIDGHWALQAGLRWETLATRSDWDDGRVSNRSQVTSPLLHLLWRPVEGGRDQLRASLTRSYRAPTLQNLVARRNLSRAYPTTGSNVATSPDRIGNPELRPELATGLDLAYEHYLSEGGLFSVSYFYRRISGLIRQVTTLQTVDWAAAPRWVSQPINYGDASTQGIELEAKYSLKEFLGADSPALELRHNLSAFRSRVAGIAGPDNRLDQQPDWTANLGADWRLKGWPLTVGASVNLTPAYTVQQTSTQWAGQDGKRVLDAYAQWTFNPVVKLRLSGSNLLARRFDTRSGVEATDASGNSQRTQASTDQPGTAGWRLELELRL